MTINPKKDYYAVLGVIPSAEAIVIRASYKALAQRYHPDKCRDNCAETIARMKEINEAYEVLSDNTKRKEYDDLRGVGTQSGDAYFDEDQTDDSPDFDPLEGDWSVALDYYPDLKNIEASLAKCSWRLAYAFKATLLETSEFRKRAELAKSIERRFLETYFGSNIDILRFAKQLINDGDKAAAKELNKAVRIFGKDIEPSRVINKIKKGYNAQNNYNPDLYPCPSCRHDIPLTAQYCVSCGKTL